MLSLEMLSIDRETARSAAQEAAQRATSLAAEVVSLEQLGGAGKRKSQHLAQSVCLDVIGIPFPKPWLTLGCRRRSIDQAILAEKCARVKAEARSNEGSGEVAKSERRTAALQKELKEAREDLEAMALEKRNLAIKAKQLESRLERAEEEREGVHQPLRVTHMSVNYLTTLNPLCMSCSSCSICSKGCSDCIPEVISGRGHHHCSPRP